MPEIGRGWTASASVISVRLLTTCVTDYCHCLRPLDGILPTNTGNPPQGGGRGEGGFDHRRSWGSSAWKRQHSCPFCWIIRPTNAPHPPWESRGYTWPYLASFNWQRSCKIFQRTSKQRKGIGKLRKSPPTRQKFVAAHPASRQLKCPSVVYCRPQSKSTAAEFSAFIFGGFFLEREGGRGFRQNYRRLPTVCGLIPDDSVWIWSWLQRTGASPQLCRYRNNRGPNIYIGGGGGEGGGG